MGSPAKGAASAESSAATIRKFHSAASWIEGAALEQLDRVALLPGVSAVAGFPDLHPGKHGPVGCAVLADRIHPLLIGNDIGCGMALFSLDIPARKLRISKAAQKMRALQEPWEGDGAKRLKDEGLDETLFPQALGTLGGGDHFCELQAVSTILDDRAASKAGLKVDGLVLLVHSGSRGMGTAVFKSVQKRGQGLAPRGKAEARYLEGHDDALIWAALNRRIIAERAATALRANLRLIADVPHNLVQRVRGGFLHRKGAAKADLPLSPLAGSRDALSYLVAPLANADKRALASIAHGAGRKYNRRSMSGRVGATKTERERLLRTSFGGQVICEDRVLLVEEAPRAYKDVDQVLKDLSDAGLVQGVAAFRPVVTFKKADKPAKTARPERTERVRVRAAR